VVRYRVDISATAEKQIRGLEKREQIRVLRAIRALATEPRPAGCRKLVGFDDVWRIRVVSFRVIYCIADRRLVVIVLKVGDRKHVYR
jgi:mRNA interferase RelE/StbE